MKPLGILVTGVPVPLAQERRGSFVDMIRAALADGGPRPIVAFQADADDALPAAADLGALLITGSAASVTERAPWMLRGEAWLAGVVAAGLPVFGLCFGHQMLAQALGGRVTANPRGREIGTVTIRRVADDELLSDSTFDANMTHVDSVVELPPGARRIGESDLDPNAAIRFGPRVWGVQFHPEFDATTLRAYVRQRADVLQREGFAPEALEAAASDAPRSRALLARFVARFAQG
ncbi:MAG: glutamine amidotransferase [Polyangiaceae bacterium]|nr:glutamine amidotransferase [Polyangiaceae bacterium]